MMEEEFQRLIDRKDAEWTHAFLAAGYLDEVKSRLSVSRGKERIFDLASLTKALFTAPLTLRFIDLSTKVRDYLTAFEKTEIGNISVGDLLSHASGLPPWINFWINHLDYHDESLNSRIEHVELRLRNTTLGKKVFCYSDVGYILLGFILEKKTGKTLKALAGEYFDPVSGLQFGPEIQQSTKSFVVPSGFCRLRQKELVGLVHDENCFSFGSRSGHCGLFSSGKALVDWLKVNFQKDGLLAPYLNQTSFPKCVDSAPAGWRRYLSSQGDERAFGHYGFTGTAFMVNPEKRTYVVLLTNCRRFSRKSRQIQTLRERVFQSAASFLE